MAVPDLKQLFDSPSLNVKILLDTIPYCSNYYRRILELTFRSFNKNGEAIAPII